MAIKKVFTARWALNTSDRMTESEWNYFRGFARYFDISDSELVEYALRYAKHTEERQRNAPFNKSSFANICNTLPGLKVMEPSLENGRLEKKLHLLADGIEAELPENTLVRYYPPYIISAEPNCQMRINIDLSEPLTIIAADKDDAIIMKTDKGFAKPLS